jgi:predicted nucleotidyltransferase
MTDDPEGIIIADMVNAIVQEAAPEKIILFGSRGRGTAMPDADVDFLIIENHPPGKKWSRSNDGSRYLFR